MPALNAREQSRRSRRLSLFNTYRSIVESASDDTIAIGKRWYQDANRTAQQLADAFSLELKQTVGIIAMMSPGTAWQENLQSAVGVMNDDWRSARAWHTFGNNNLQTAWQIRLGIKPLEEALRGRKVNAFYRSIMLEDGAACDDAWMYSANRLGYKSNSPPKGHHIACQEACKMLSSHLGWATYQVQAVIWTHLKRSAQSPGETATPISFNRLINTRFHYA